MTAPHTTPTPGWLVAVLGALLLPLAGGAFVLSFEQQLPVMMLGGWGPRTAPLGPVVLDLAASAGAVMHVVARDRQVRAWDWACWSAPPACRSWSTSPGTRSRCPAARPGR